MNTITNTFLISAELSNQSKQDNEIATKQLIKNLLDSGVLYRVVEGSYKGTKEVSFAVLDESPSNPHTRRLVEFLAAKFKQDAYAHVDSNRHVTIHYSNGNIESKGRLNSSILPPNSDSYTKIGEFYHYTSK